MAEGEAPGDYINQRQDLHDCFFLVGNLKKERISTVKFFLVNYSPYFRKMLLETDMKEKGSKEDIVIPDHEPDVFKLMLSYVYGSQTLIFKDVDQAMRFHLLVDKCLMSKLKKISSDYLTKHCTTDICEVLECHVLLEIKEMKSRAAEMVKYNTASLIASEDFVDLNTAIILFIVKQETLSISEVELWNGVLKWARHQSGTSNNAKKIRNTLREVLKHMRFLTMSSKQFAEQVVPTSVLTSEEMIAVFVSMATGENCSLTYMCSKKRAPITFNMTLDIDLKPLGQQHECSCTIEVYTKKLQLISINLEEGSAQVIKVRLIENNNTIFNLGASSPENEYKLCPPFELQSNKSYVLTVGYQKQFLSASMGGQRTSGRQRNAYNPHCQTRTDIFACNEFCTIKKAIDFGHSNTYYEQLFMSCFKSLQFQLMTQDE